MTALVSGVPIRSSKAAWNGRSMLPTRSAHVGERLAGGLALRWSGVADLRAVPQRGPCFVAPALAKAYVLHPACALGLDPFDFDFSLL